MKDIAIHFVRFLIAAMVRDGAPTADTDVNLIEKDEDIQMLTLDELIGLFEQNGDGVERRLEGGEIVIEAFHCEGLARHIDDTFVLAACKFAECANIDSLWIPDSTVTDESICKIAHFRRLEYLNLRGSKITDTSLQFISKLPLLVSLDLSETEITATGAESLQHLAQLEVLNIQGTKVSDEGCHFVSRLPKLTHLYLQRCPVTDSCLRHFERQQSLTDINLWLTKLSAEAIIEFMTRRPDIDVAWDRRDK